MQPGSGGVINFKSMLDNARIANLFKGPLEVPTFKLSIAHGDPRLRASLQLELIKLFQIHQISKGEFLGTKQHCTGPRKKIIELS